MSRHQNRCTPDLAPGEQSPFWSPISATLIFGERDAVLVDALLTVGQAHDPGRMDRRARKEPHDRVHHTRSWGPLVRARRGPRSLPNAHAFALLAVIEHVRLGSTPVFFESFWTPRFDGKRVVDRRACRRLVHADEARRALRSTALLGALAHHPQRRPGHTRASALSRFRSCGPARCRAWKQRSARSAASPSFASRTLAMRTSGPARIRQATAGTRRSRVTESTPRLWRWVAR